MKKNLLTLGILLVTAGAVLAGTNELIIALQKGLFEEEANHNLEAAIQAYQSVTTQFDRDRKLAATAIFRLAECYRKLGQTNEANARYERILREFSDQAPLVSLSRQNLVDADPKAAPISAQTSIPLNPQGKIPVVRQGDIPTIPLTGASEEAREIDRLQKLLQESPDLVNKMDETGETRLQAAAYRGQMLMAKFLLAHGAEVEAKSMRGQNRTALLHAAGAGHKGIVDLLLEHHANFHAVDNSGYTALHLAAENGFRSIVETLLDHGAAVNATAFRKETPLHLAAANGFRAVAELLLARGATSEGNATPYVSGENYEGTPLHIAAQRGDQGLAELLLNHHAKLNVFNQSGLTPLHLAAEKGGLAVATMLLARGAEVDARSTSPGTRDWPPLVSAIDRRQIALANLLLTNGADPNLSFSSDANHPQDMTPLLWAVYKSEPEIVALLLGRKADANLKSRTGDFPLLRAITTRSERGPAIIQLLLDHGADVEERASSSASPLMMAAATGNLEAMALLLAHHAKVNAQDNRGWSALHFAAYRSLGPSPAINSDDTGAALIAGGADVNLRNFEGFTPLTLITRQSQLPMITSAVAFTKMLRNHGALEDLPRLDVLQIRGASDSSNWLTLPKGTNDWNQFTALELLAMTYGLLTAAPQGEQQNQYSKHDWSRQYRYLGFPNLSHLRLKRPGTNYTSWEDGTLDISRVLDSGDCAGDIRLGWGDILVVAEADHPLNEIWTGFSKIQLENLSKCLARVVKVVVKGQSTALNLRPIIEPSGQVQNELMIRTRVAFWIKPALRGSNLLLTSSDLRHVNVTRPASAGGPLQKWVLDCSDDQPAPDFWLRDGDVIEVPDKQ